LARRRPISDIEEEEEDAQFCFPAQWFPVLVCLLLYAY